MIDPSPVGRDRLRRSFLTGVAVIVPSVITLAVLGVVFNAIYNYLNAFSSAVASVLPADALPIGRRAAIEIATPIAFVASILVIGVVVESTRHGQRVVDYADYAIEQILGVGSVYQGFRQMSDAMLESDSGNFQEVILVEFPTEAAYTLAFVTSETPDAIAESADGGKMRTLFMPMAPNPVMGGHVLFVPERRVVEVDLTVEEGIRALVTSGVALERAASEADGVSPDQVREVARGGRIGPHHASMSDAAKRTDGDHAGPGDERLAPDERREDQ